MTTEPRPVRYRCELFGLFGADAVERVKVRVLDLSESGAFVESCPELPDLQEGDLGQLTLSLPGIGAWQAATRVSRYGKSRLEIKNPAVAHLTVVREGFGVEFDALPDDTLVFPGHDYIETNLAFTLDREPDNVPAGQMLDGVKTQAPETRVPTTIGVEKKINTFFRLDSPTVIRHLRMVFSDLPDRPDTEEVFLRLRQMRNDW